MTDKERCNFGDEANCVVHVPASRFEADIISQALRREGIPCACKTHEDTAYDGIFVLQRGWGSILVPLSCRERALAIVRDAVEAYRLTCVS